MRLYLGILNEAFLLVVLWADVLCGGGVDRCEGEVALGVHPGGQESQEDWWGRRSNIEKVFYHEEVTVRLNAGGTKCIKDYRAHQICYQI